MTGKAESETSSLVEKKKTITQDTTLVEDRISPVQRPRAQLGLGARV